MMTLYPPGDRTIKNTIFIWPANLKEFQNWNHIGAWPQDVVTDRVLVVI